MLGIAREEQSNPVELKKIFGVLPGPTQSLMPLRMPIGLFGCGARYPTFLNTLYMLGSFLQT